MYCRWRMKGFGAEIDIAAPPARVWALLTDLPSDPTWNTTVDKVEGSIALGHKLKVFVKLDPGRAFPVKVAELVPNERMVWRGGLPLGRFEGERTYTLTPAGGGTRFAMHEVFSGLMSGMIAKSIPDLQPAFDEFARALKMRAERA